jgi:Uma2 family endonuclease
MTPPLSPAGPPTGTEPSRWKWSREDYYKLGELGLFRGRRVQLVFGEIVEMSPMGWQHALATSKTGDLLRLVFTPGFWVNEQRPFRAAGSEPEPDVAVIPGAKSDYTDHPDRATLLVEVADTTLTFDTTTKAELYATAGVPEYWVVDVIARQLHVFRDPVPLPAGLGATAYRTHLALGQTDIVSPLAIPSATVAVADLLP